MPAPLADKVRPTLLSEIIGQPHLTGINGIITNMLQNKNITSLIFYGPPGTGKTTTANIIANSTSHPIYKLNATTASVKDVHKAIDENKDNLPVLLYLDEIQYFNKKQQQSLLPFIESGEMLLIASTTENPYHALYDALLSRCTVCEFKKPTTNQIAERLLVIAQNEYATDINFDVGAYHHIAAVTGGDVRRAVNLLELSFNQFKDRFKQTGRSVSIQDVSSLVPAANMSGFDTDSDIHYALISGLQKSIRGSDPDAAVFYLAKLLEGGDILSPCRRLLVIANEDIGLADPQALAIVYALVETAKELGLPEANKPLTNAVLLLALAPKSCTAESTYNPAAEDVKNGLGAVVPFHLRHACSPGYKWPHEYPYHWCPQQYLPDDIKDKQYYHPGDNSFEQNLNKYWTWIKQNWHPN